MPFLRSSTRPRAVECFFCLSPSLLQPPQPVDRKGKGRAVDEDVTRRWMCAKCGCWNVRDSRGRMVDHLPAMHNSDLNTESFSLRGQPSSLHLPPSSATSIFCHSCLANQTLIMNMLANYLPEDDDPSFPSLLDALPSYLAGLHERYPPVCHNCQPAVDEALRKSDMRAQSEALGMALQNGRPPSSVPTLDERVRPWEVALWKTRGVLWWIGVALSFGQAIQPFLEKRRVSLPTLNMGVFGMTALDVLSILWIAWNPYWLRTVRAKSRLPQSDGPTWLTNMLSVYTFRNASRVFKTISPYDVALFGMTIDHLLKFAEIFMLLSALAQLRPPSPIPLRLVRPVNMTLVASEPPTRPASPARVGLSSSHVDGIPSTTSPRSNPIFGQTSLGLLGPADPSEPMDWEPLPSSDKHSVGGLDEAAWGSTSPHASDWDTFGVGKQRMFERTTQETGLESLLAGWGLGPTAERSTDPASSRQMMEPDSNASALWPRKSTMALLMIGLARFAVTASYIFGASQPVLSVGRRVIEHQSLQQAILAAETALNTAWLVQGTQPTEAVAIVRRACLVLICLARFAFYGRIHLPLQVEHQWVLCGSLDILAVILHA